LHTIVEATMISRSLLALVFAAVFISSMSVEARMRAPSLGFTKGECSLLGGDVDDLGGGSWACCFEESGQCWNCSGQTSGPAAGHCSCLGDGCPADKAVQPGIRIGPLGSKPNQQ
jgi:hypothetical protein